MVAVYVIYLHENLYLIWQGLTWERLLVSDTFNLYLLNSLEIDTTHVRVPFVINSCRAFASRTLTHSSFKPLKNSFRLTDMSVPWKVWISESKWKYKHTRLKQIPILLTCYYFRPWFSKKEKLNFLEKLASW